MSKGVISFFFNNLIQIIAVIVHDDIQKLLRALSSNKVVFHDQYVGVFDLLQNLQLSVLIFFVLKHFLDSNFLVGGNNTAIVDSTKRTLSSDTLDLVLVVENVSVVITVG